MRDRRHGEQRQRDRRQDELGERAAEGREVPRQQRIDEVEPGHGVRWAVGDLVDPAERLRRPAQQVVEDVDQQQRHEEGWERGSDRDDAAAEVVDPGVGPRRRPHAERHGGRDRDDERRQRQLHRGRQPLHQVAQHGLARRQRVAEVAPRQARGVARELLGQAPVEAQALADLRHRLRVGSGPGEVDGGIAGQGPRQQEGDEDDADQARQRAQQSSRDESHVPSRAPVCRESSGKRRAKPRATRCDAACLGVVHGRRAVRGGGLGRGDLYAKCDKCGGEWQLPPRQGRRHLTAGGPSPPRAGRVPRWSVHGRTGRERARASRSGWIITSAMSTGSWAVSVGQARSPQAARCASTASTSHPHASRSTSPAVLPIAISR